MKVRIMLHLSSSFCVIDIEGFGRGAIAQEDLEVGDIALEIPVPVIISEDAMKGSDMYPVLQRIDGISVETMLLLWSMKERYNSSSKYKIYFDMLPREFNTGLSFGIDAIMVLDGTILLEEIIQAKEHLRTQYEELFPTLCDAHPDVFPPELFTWEHYLWACELWYSNSMKIQFADGELRICLIPIAGFLNHSLYPHISRYGKVDPVTNSLKFPMSRPCRVGEQCFLSYGNFSSSHLIIFYGFLPHGDNPYDVIPLDIDNGFDGDNNVMDSCKHTTHMLRGTWFSNNCNIFSYGLPSPLLDYLRNARNMSDTESPMQDKLEVEAQVLEDLYATFSSMMEGLSDTNPDTRENIEWDVKLALQYKDLQRRIMSSILRSCSSGLKMLEDEHERSHSRDHRENGCPFMAFHFTVLLKLTSSSNGGMEPCSEDIDEWGVHLGKAVYSAAIEDNHGGHPSDDFHSQLTRAYSDVLFDSNNIDRSKKRLVLLNKTYLDCWITM
ncbi:hypothetical protein SAY87_017437 [Trapa incisa]|uniref:SET domain-containing protein n=1 Tax=Trapa incisa TaxID=236973 RepID=A0AAN7L8J6_9MYRT|nr:hypothetical protein SAY87_017437 [Trapa incisa]